jgi:hypothetical protein
MKYRLTQFAPDSHIGEHRQIGSASDLARRVKGFGPVNVIDQQSSRRMPNSPGI